MTVEFPPSNPGVPKPSAAWPKFERKLAVVLKKLQEGHYLILSAQQSGRLIQFAAQGQHGMRIETTSNNYLSGVDQLSPVEISSLTSTGWGAPTGDRVTSTPENDPNGSPNFFVQFAAPVPYEAVAKLAVRTIAEILRIPHPRSLQYQAFDEEQSEIALPTLALSSPGQQANRAIRSILKRPLSEDCPDDWSALIKSESPSQNDLCARLLVRWALTGTKSEAALQWFLPAVAPVFSAAKSTQGGEECLNLILNFVRERKEQAQAAVKKGDGLIATMWAASIAKKMTEIEPEIVAAANTLGIVLDRAKSSMEESSQFALVEWERSFRAAARQDSNRILRAHLRGLGLPEEPDRLLEGTILVVQMCVTYLVLDNQPIVSFLEQQQYDPKTVTDAPYQVTFDIFGAAYARISTPMRLKYLDLADLYEVPWDQYKSVGYHQLFISRTDGEHLTTEAVRALEEEVTRDLRFDYAEDELNFWFDPDTVEGVLIVALADPYESDHKE